MHCLVPVPVSAFVGSDLADRMESSTLAHIAYAHLCDGQTDRFVCPDMRSEHRFFWPKPTSEEFSAVFRCFQDRSYLSLMV